MFLLVVVVSLLPPPTDSISFPPFADILEYASAVCELTLLTPMFFDVPTASRSWKGGLPAAKIRVSSVPRALSSPTTRLPGVLSEATTESDATGSIHDPGTSSCGSLSGNSRSFLLETGAVRHAERPRALGCK